MSHGLKRSWTSGGYRNRYVVHNISVPILPKTQIRQTVAPDTSELVAMHEGEKEPLELVD